VIQSCRLRQSERTSIRLANQPTTRRTKLFSKRQLLRAAQLMGPTLVALAFPGVAHAQGTMDFSGTQTLMGTFKTCAAMVAGSHASGLKMALTPRNPSNATPMMVNGVSLISMVRPTMFASWWKRIFHALKLRTATGALPGVRISPGRKKRPFTGCRPRASKYPDMTGCPNSRSDPAFSVRVSTSGGEKPPISSLCRTRSP